ncbi:hypothetical protein EMCRGX_G018014 [Ephydatia muelleri]
MKLLLHQVASAASMNLLAYYHNEAATGKYICDTHFAHMQARVAAYISEGEGGRKVSTAKQLAVALSSKCGKDTTVLLVKPKHDAPFVSTKVPAIQGISNFYAVDHKTLARAPPSSTSENSFGHSGINFTGCKVVLHNLGTEKAISRVRSRYKASIKKHKRLNAVTKKDAQPLPRIDETLDVLWSARWFSCLDLTSGYWQVEVAPEDREKTAFVTPYGLFQFRLKERLVTSPILGYPVFNLMVDTDASGDGLGAVLSHYISGVERVIAFASKSLCKAERKKLPPAKLRAPLQLDPAVRPLQRVAMDIMGPLPETSRGNKYILVIADYFTKWSEAYPIPNMEASSHGEQESSEEEEEKATPSEEQESRGEEEINKEPKDSMADLQDEQYIYPPQPPADTSTWRTVASFNSEQTSSRLFIATDLRGGLRTAKLSTTGNKATLVQRLLEHDDPEHQQTHDSSSGSSDDRDGLGRLTGSGGRPHSEECGDRSSSVLSSARDRPRGPRDSERPEGPSGRGRSGGGRATEKHPPLSRRRAASRSRSPTSKGPGSPTQSTSVSWATGLPRDADDGHRHRRGVKRRRAHHTDSSSRSGSSSSSSSSDSSSSSRDRHRHHHRRRRSSTAFSDPPFISCSATPAKYLLKRIRRGKFVTFDKLLLPVLDETLVVGQAAKRTRSAKRHVVDLATWLEAWNVFLAVRLQVSPSSALQLAKYQAIMCQLFSSYPVGVCIKYDSLFRQAVARDKSHFTPWGQVKDDILLWCAIRHPIRAPKQPSANPLQSSATNGATKSTQGRVTHTQSGQEICRKFNFASCNRAECSFAYKCWFTGCLGDHPGKSCPRAPAAPGSELSKEIAAGRVLGPFTEKPFVNLQTSGLGAAPKKNGMWRVILHLSAPYGVSVNDGISKEEFSLHYLLLMMLSGCFSSMALVVSWQNVEAIHYLDDFLLVGPAGQQQCATSVQSTLSACGNLGIPVAFDKLEAKVVPAGRLFLRRLIDLSTTAKKLHHHIRITADAREDLAWWECFLPEWNGVVMFLDPDWTSANTLNLFTDASGTSGYGAYFNGSWFRGSWLPHQQLGMRSIQWQELFAIVAAAKAWGPRLAKCRVRFHCDNQAIVYAWSGQSSKDVAIMKLLRELFFTAANHNFSVQLVHIPGQHNPVADALSCTSYHGFSPLPHRWTCIPPLPHQSWQTSRSHPEAAGTQGPGPLYLIHLRSGF